MPPRYFQGVSVHGPVSASPASSFREVVDALRILAPLDISRASFLALNKKERNEKKQVPFLVPAVFDQSPSKRTSEHALHCNLIFLDLDEDKDGKCPAAPFYNNPKSLEVALAGFNFAAHTTASSTPEKPRMRIIIDSANIPIERYADAVATIARMLGLPTLTRESKVPVQCMFLPVQFSDSTDEDHPLIAWRIDGRAFTEADIDDSAHHPKSSQANGSNGKNGHLSTTPADGLEFLRSPVPEVTLQIAKDALSHISPDCSYFDWIETAAALKHQFDHSHPDKAYELFDEWSLRPTPVGRCPVTIRSLLAKAVTNGWNDTKVKQSCFSEVVRWMEEVQTFTELIDHAVSKILACPLLSSTQEDLLVNMVCSQSKKRFAFSISPTFCGLAMVSVCFCLRL